MIYIVVLNWNGAIDTINCVKSLMNLNYDDYKIIVVDNCSTDNSYDSIKENLNALYITGKSFIEVKYEDRSKYQTFENDKIILIQSPKNNGYASGNNIGIELALNQEDMKYVWVLNNDTEVDKEALTHLISKCDSDKNIGICGSRLVYFTDR
ncbi:glycosyltransferase, partial [Escherichia coli]|nr:glycosyltransferase [Escherichia coli]